MLDWEILAGGDRCIPAAAASLRQRPAGAEGAAPVALETVVRAGSGDVSQSVYVGRPAGAGAGGLGVLEVRNRTSAPVAVTLALRSGDFWRSDGLWLVEIDDAGVFANGERVLWWQRAPSGVRLVADAAATPDGTPEPPPAAGWVGLPQRVRGPGGRATAEFTWPVTHGTELQALLPLEVGEEAPPAPEVVPTLAQVGRGWDLHTAGGLRLTALPDGRIGTLVAAAVRRLLALEIGPSAGDGPDGRLSPAGRALVAVALAVAGYTRRAAEVVSVRAARNPASVTRPARREAARVTAPFGGAPALIAEMASAAGAGGGWAGDGGGDDAALRAAFLLAVADSLVSQRDGCLDLLAGVGGDLGGSRPPIEVHRLVTAYGALSFALRWHEATPALLWELTPPATPLESWASVLVGGSADAGATSAPELRAGVLSESWSTNRLAGESLLGT